MLLTQLILLPLIGAIPLCFVRDKNAREIKVWTLIVTLITFVASLPLWMYEPSRGLFQFVEDREWVARAGLNIRYSLGVDGISALLILLTTFISPLAVLGAWKYIHDRQKEFYIAMLLMQAAVIGAFAATDLFLFYVFFEASLIPMYLIIGVWGGDERIYATTKFILYTAFGSLLMFLAILYVYFKAGGASFSITQLAQQLAQLRQQNELDPQHVQGLTRAAEAWCFAAFALAFAIKVPLFPVHTWLPDAHVQAPTPGSVILAALLLKLGGYGFLRLVIPFFPRAFDEHAMLLMVICVIGIVYGSMMAFAQRDIKKLIAYSSVAHMGTCMLGIFSLQAVGIQGGVYQMINHGVSTGALFLMAGMIYERTHNREIDHYGGLAGIIPRYTIFFIIVTLSSIGLPLTNGFVGEFTCIMGAFDFNPWLGLGGALGMVLGAVYMLYLVRRVFFGPVKTASNKSLEDLTARETAILVPLVAMIFLMGIVPGPFFDRMAPATQTLLLQARRPKALALATPTTLGTPPVVPAPAPQPAPAAKVEPKK